MRKERTTRSLGRLEKQLSRDATFVLAGLAPGVECEALRDTDDPWLVQ